MCFYSKHRPFQTIGVRRAAAVIASTYFPFLNGRKRQREKTQLEAYLKDDNKQFFLIDHHWPLVNLLYMMNHFSPLMNASLAIILQVFSIH